MSRLEIRATGIEKNFNRRAVLRDVNFSVATGESLAITGKNGSGKSTLIKIIAGLLTQSKGELQYTKDESAAQIDELRPEIGLVSPYLQLYDEFTAMENLLILMRIRTNPAPDGAEAELLFRRFELWERRKDFVRTFSSGMKQRLKYIVALAHKPSVLFLDEPTANLDEDGSRIVREVVEEARRALIIIATNDDREAGWCKKRIHMGA